MNNIRKGHVRCLYGKDSMKINKDNNLIDKVCYKQKKNFQSMIKNINKN